MKKIYTILSISFSCLVFSQTGIGTTTPRDQLDVVGNILLEDYLILTQTQEVSGEYNLLVRSEDTVPKGEVKILNASTRNVAPINKYLLKISNVAGDVRVIKLNTGLSVDKYFVGLAESIYSGGEIIQSNAVGNGSTAIPIHGTYVATVEKATGVNPNYLITLDFNAARANSSANETWDVSLIVYEKTLVKDWGTFTGSVTQAASYSGVSTNTPIGLQ